MGASSRPKRRVGRVTVAGRRPEHDAHIPDALLSDEAVEGLLVLGEEQERLPA